VVFTTSYKFKMMGISIGAPAFVSGDNQSVLANTSHPHSILKKKSSSIAYHFVREGVTIFNFRMIEFNILIMTLN